MDPQQRQTSADAQAQPQAQAHAPNANANGAPPFDPSLLPQMPNPDAMAGIFNGQGFISNPNMAVLPMGDPAMMLPLMFANGQVPSQSPQQAKPISAGNVPPSAIPPTTGTSS
jgi:hypothetical protein